MRSKDILKSRTAGVLSTLILGAGALTGCGDEPPNPPAPTNSSSAEGTSTSLPSGFPYHAVSVPGIITNTENTAGEPVGTLAYSDPYVGEQDRKAVIKTPLSQNATVRVLCRIAVGSTQNLERQSSPKVVGKLGATRTDWDLLQKPLPDTIIEIPDVAAGAHDAAGWVPAGFVLTADQPAKCQNLPS